MVVVGYDDNKQAYKIFNSWGTSWGDNGFGWISYPLFESKVREAYTAQDIVIVDPNRIVEEPDDSIDDIDFPRPVETITLNAWLGKPIVVHNIPVQTNFGIFPGMSISIPGSIENAQGSWAQIILRFYFPDGRPLFANNQEPFYRDVHGLAATGTPVFPIYHNPSRFDHMQLKIPYYALNLQPTNMTARYPVAVNATLYINSFEKARSQLSEMIIVF